MKTKLFVKILSTCLIALIFFYSCQKVENVSTQKTNHLLRSSPNPKNTDNDYDATGQMHNEIMSLLIDTNIVKPNCNSFFISKMYEYALNNSYDTTNLDTFLNGIRLKIKPYFSFLSNGDFIGYYDALEDSGLITALQHHYLLQIYSTIDSIADYVDEEEGINEGCERLIKRIKAIENTIIHDNNFGDEEEKALVLSSSSVARYSMTNYLDYSLEGGGAWTDVFAPYAANHHIDFYPIDPEDMGMTLWCWNWGEVGHWDVAGTVGGGAVVGVGALFGGPVTWAAVGAGTVGTGVGASVTQFVYYWSHGAAVFLWP